MVTASFCVILVLLVIARSIIGDGGNPGLTTVVGLQLVRAALLKTRLGMTTLGSKLISVTAARLGGRSKLTRDFRFLGKSRIRVCLVGSRLLRVRALPVSLSVLCRASFLLVVIGLLKGSPIRTRQDRSGLLF